MHAQDRPSSSRLLVLFATLALTLSSAIPVAAGDAPPLPVTHQKFDFFVGPLSAGLDAGLKVDNYRNPPNPICTTSSTDANVNVDCEGTAPYNETTVAVNPTDSDNIIAALNDYQLQRTPGGTVWESGFTRSHASFDGGETWTTYPIPFDGYMAVGDPVVAFDADGTAYLADIGFVWSQNIGCCTNPDVIVSRSADGGRHWKTTRVAAGSGSFSSAGKFNDKEAITAWGHGNAIATWTQFLQGRGGSYISSAILASVTHDSGKTWSKPAVISGSAAFCTGAQGGTNCDQSQGSVPVAQWNGTGYDIYVSFLNYPYGSTTRDQYLVVKVNPSTGQRSAGPYNVGLVYDGATDYPFNIDGRQTYHDSQFRTWAMGAIAADPSNPGHLAVVWSDMRNSDLPADPDPYAATASTDSDIVVSQSTDGGVNWSAPAAIARSGDQFMPWAVYDTDSRLRIGFFDRSYDTDNHAYGYTLANETGYGTLAFGLAQLTTALSDPTMDTRWFSGRTPNEDFPHPTTFLGDYSGIAAGPSGSIVAVWTDMRNTVTFGTRSGASEDGYFAAYP